MSTDYYTVGETVKRRGFGKILRKIYARKEFLLSSRMRRCLCCQKPTLVVCLDDTGEAHRCLRCGANLRYELLAQYIRGSNLNLAQLTILEVDPSSPLRPLLERGRTYTRSFWSDQVALGTLRQDGARCEDLTKLSFPDKSFDLIVSSEVLEHIEQREVALAEIRRVLRPGGIHVFTVPVSGDATVQRAKAGRNGQIEHLVAPEFHGDPEGDGGGILAYWTFGTDACSYLSIPGLATRIGAERRTPEGNLIRQVFVSQRTD